MNTIKIFLGSCLGKMSSQIHKQKRLSDKESMYGLLNLINEKKEILQVDAFDQLGFGVRQGERAHRNLMSKFDFEICFKKGKYSYKVTMKKQERLGI